MTNHLSARSSWRSLLLLLLLAPGVGLAAQETAATEQQPPPASSGLPGTQARAPLRLSEDALSREETASRPSRGARILAEAGGGLLAGLGGGFAGVMTGNAMCEEGLVGPPGGFLMPCLGANLVGLLLGVGVGVPLGVWGGGLLMGGNANPLGAMAGVGLGLVAGVFVGMTVPSPLGFLLALSLPLIGSIMGYEATQPDPGPRAPAVASTPPRLQPVLAFSPHGALVGLGGSF